MQLAVIDYKQIVVPPTVLKRVEKMLHSWRSVHPSIAAMSDSPKNLELLGAMLSHEINSPVPRQLILTRLHMKINAMRSELERKRVLKYAKV